MITPPPFKKDNKVPNILCGCSIAILVLNFIKFIYISLTNGGVFYADDFMVGISLLSNLTPIIGFVLVIISRVTYPDHKLSKILLWIYVVGIVLVGVIIIWFTVYCFTTCLG